MTQQDNLFPPALDPIDVMERAMDAPRGTQVVFTDETAAKDFRRRCYTILRRERSRNQKTIGDSSCEWDVLTFRLKQQDSGAFAVQIFRGEPNIQSIEDL